MGKGGGGSGGGRGGGGAGIAAGVGRGGGVSIRGGVEGGGGGFRGAAPVSGLARMDRGPAFEAAPFAPRPIVGEGPVGLAALKLTVPLGEIRFNNKPALGSDLPVRTEPISLAPVKKPAIFAALPLLNRHTREFFPAQVGPVHRKEVLNQENKRLEQMVPLKAPASLEQPKPQPAVSAALKPAVQTYSQTETKAHTQVKPLTLVQPALAEQAAEEVVTERVVSKQASKGQQQVKTKEKKFVVDEPTLAQRLHKAMQSARQARLEAEKLGLGKKIIGRIVNKFLSLSQRGDLSKVVRPDGPDGTIPIIKETIRAQAEFASESEVARVVLQNRPVSEEEGGEPVSDEEVRKVFDERTVKPSRPVDLVHKRTVQKQLSRQPVAFAVAGKQIEGKDDTTLRNLGLADIFSRAA